MCGCAEMMMTTACLPRLRFCNELHCPHLGRQARGCCSYIYSVSPTSSVGNTLVVWLVMIFSLCYVCSWASYICTYMHTIIRTCVHVYMTQRKYYGRVDE